MRLWMLSKVDGKTMRLLHNTEASLIGDSMAEIAVIESLVRSFHPEIASEKREWVKCTGDSRAFLDISMRNRASGVSVVLIEFGVHADDQRHVSGFFDAEWNFGVGVSKINAVAIEGNTAGLHEFIEQMEAFAGLPVIASEESEAFAWA